MKLGDIARDRISSFQGGAAPVSLVARASGGDRPNPVGRGSVR